MCSGYALAPKGMLVPSQKYSKRYASPRRYIRSPLRVCLSQDTRPKIYPKGIRKVRSSQRVCSPLRDSQGSTKQVAKAPQKFLFRLFAFAAFHITSRTGWLILSKWQLRQSKLKYKKTTTQLDATMLCAFFG